MDVDAMRERNQAKAEAEAAAGPARAEPDATPIGDAIEDFHRRDGLSFAIPAHRAGMGDVVPVIDYLEQLAATGVMVEGAADTTLAEFRVVAEG